MILTHLKISDSPVVERVGIVVIKQKRMIEIVKGMLSAAKIIIGDSAVVV
ncbi:MAG: hypothetical protein Q8M56_00495 [Desulfobacterales bacterium]|nr:hypothetical protein [Desulfobacterales bacterium]